MNGNTVKQRHHQQTQAAAQAAASTLTPAPALVIIYHRHSASVAFDITASANASISIRTHHQVFDIIISSIGTHLASLIGAAHTKKAANIELRPHLAVAWVAQST